MNRVLSIACGVMALALCVRFVPGCSWGGSAAFTAARTAAVPQTSPGPVNVETENGWIAVTADSTGEVRVGAAIRATTRARADAVKIAAEQDAEGLVTVRVVWPDGKRLSNEGASLDVHVPAASELRLHTTNGRVTVDGGSGPVGVQTSNGRVKITGRSGVVSVSTSNGSVEVSDAQGGTVKTSNGSVTLRLGADASSPIDVSSSNGSITMEIGQGYGATVTATTSNGSITSMGQRVAKGTPVRVGSGECKATLATSNGSITIKTRG